MQRRFKLPWYIFFFCNTNKEFESSALRISCRQSILGLRECLNVDHDNSDQGRVHRVPILRFGMV